MSPRATRWLAAALLAVALPAGAVESDPLPVPAGERGKAVALYNEGVKVMLDKRYAEAQRLFEQALALDEGLAQAHNNLAFSLRMQSRENFAKSLRHYQRALEIDPKLVQAYMYRGVLYTQMGDTERAKADLERLRSLDGSLAAKLEKVMAESAARDERDGLAPQLEGIY